MMIALFLLRQVSKIYRIFERDTNDLQKKYNIYKKTTTTTTTTKSLIRFGNLSLIFIWMNYSIYW